jgi:DNA-binding NarL/FixJ family response regulator
LLEGLAQALNGIPDIDVIGTAVDGDALIELVAATDPDVILVDIEMPRTTGLAALGTMENGPPAIVVTMHADESHRARAEAVGAVGFMSKSTPLPDLAGDSRHAQGSGPLGRSGGADCSRERIAQCARLRRQQHGRPG